MVSIAGKKIAESYGVLLRRGDDLANILSIFIVVARKAGWTPEEILEAVEDALSDGNAHSLQKYFP
jgi:hypothetical protein